MDLLGSVPEPQLATSVDFARRTPKPLPPVFAVPLRDSDPRLAGVDGRSWRPTLLSSSALPSGDPPHGDFANFLGRVARRHGPVRAATP